MEENVPTLNDLQFCDEKESVFTSVSNAIDNMEPYLTQRATIENPATDLSFDPTDSIAQIRIKGIPYRVTKHALKTLCALVRIPDPFARNIPIDLLETNFKRLIPLLCASVDIVQRPGTGLVTALVPTTYEPFKSIDFLLGMNDIFKELDAQNVTVSVNYRNIVISGTSPKFPNIEPVKNDIVAVGLTASNSEVKDCKTHASLYLLRLACTNGATMPEKEWGGVNYNYSSKYSYEDKCGRFLQGIVSLQSNFIAMQKVFEELPNLNLDSESVVYLTKLCGKIVDRETAATAIFGTRKEDLQEWSKYEKDRKTFRAFSGVSPIYGHGPLETEINAYNVYNKITEYSRSGLVSRDSALIAQAIGGQMLTHLYKKYFATAK